MEAGFRSSIIYYYFFHALWLTPSKYQRWCDQILERARKRGKLISNKETHHLQPKSLYGDDDPLNLIDLTYREHFTIHRLLLKIVVGSEAKSKMAYALHRMTHSSVTNRRLVAGWQIEKAKRALTETWHKLRNETYLQQYGIPFNDLISSGLRRRELMEQPC